MPADQCSSQSERVLWATPNHGDEPEKYEHVKTTAKQIQAKARQGWVERFSREGVPAGILGTKEGYGSDQRRWLFDDKASCLRHMAMRARMRADAAEQKAATLRAWADERQAEAREIEDARGDHG